MGADTHTGRRALQGELAADTLGFAGVSGSPGQGLPGSTEASIVLRAARLSPPTTPNAWVTSVSGTSGKRRPWEVVVTV